MTTPRQPMQAARPDDLADGDKSSRVALVGCVEALCEPRNAVAKLRLHNRSIRIVGIAQRFVERRERP